MTSYRISRIAAFSAAAISLLSPTLLQAELSLPQIFSSHMVLQQDKAIQVWGRADANADVEVSFAGRAAKVKAGKDGKWQAELPAQKTNAKGQSLTVKSGKDQKKFDDVLVGEVWIASGQSNMQWSVRSSNDAEKEIAAAKFPHIRLFQATTETAAEPQEDLANTWGGWTACTPESIPGFTGVGYFFGRELHEYGKVPVGIIQSAWSGTRSEAWTSREALLSDPNAEDMMVDWRVQEALYDETREQEKYKTNLVKWKAAVKKIRAANAVEKDKAKHKRMPRKPGEPTAPRLSYRHPSSIYNAMIAPLVPYGIRGAIWYQGESNQNRAVQYASIFPTMIEDWREQWNDDFPFLFVQLANYGPATDDANEASPWAELQWSQYLTLKEIKDTGMAVTNEIGSSNNIHPPNKQDVGKRLSRWAFSMDPFKTKLVVSGPLYKGMKIERDGIRIFFDHIGSGLKLRTGQKLQNFAIAGEDKVFHWGDAYIEGNTVVVTSRTVKKPVAVRYAWANNPENANLMNKEGLPASLFRTDSWPLATQYNTSPFPNLSPPFKAAEKKVVAAPVVKKTPAPTKPAPVKKPKVKKSNDKKPKAKPERGKGRGKSQKRMKKEKAKAGAEAEAKGRGANKK